MQSSTATILLNTIGTFHCQEKERYLLPNQPGVGKANFGKIVLNAHQNYEQALEDLDGFSHIWILFLFHKNKGWKPKVLTPRGNPKRGLFGTRSPHRPNPIGMSCVELIEIKGLELMIANHDLLDGTPILDIKPYVEYSDCKVNTQQGWLGEQQAKSQCTLIFSPVAEEQLDYLKHNFQLDLKTDIFFRLSTNPLPKKNNRIIKIDSQRYQLAYKTWRILYQLTGDNIEILSISSGYDTETLKGTKSSKWDDVPVHRAYVARYPTNDYNPSVDEVF